MAQPAKDDVFEQFLAEELAGLSIDVHHLAHVRYYGAYFSALFPNADEQERSSARASLPNGHSQLEARVSAIDCDRVEELVRAFNQKHPGRMRVYR